MPEEVVNVMCIKWGTMYGPHYVNRLRAMVSRNLSRPHRFVCLTDDASELTEDIEVFPIPDIYIPEKNANSPWRKLSTLNQEIGNLAGKTLFLDLDIVILDSIDCFFTFSDKFTIIENWTQPGRGIGNSSVYLFEVGRYSNVLEYFKENYEAVTATYPNEQVYLSKTIGDIAYWPDEWCQSFKFHAIPSWPKRVFRPPEIPEGCKILVFHGHPNPDQAVTGNYGSRLHKYFRPAPWITDYWRE